MNRLRNEFDAHRAMAQQPSYDDGVRAGIALALASIHKTLKVRDAKYFVGGALLGSLAAVVMTLAWHSLT